MGLDLVCAKVKVAENKVNVEKLSEFCPNKTL